MKRFITVAVLVASLFGLMQFDSNLMSTVAIAKDAGRATDIASTAHITHATPAAAYAPSIDRNWDIEVPMEVTKEAFEGIAAMLTEQSLEGTIAALEGGASNIPLIVATALIEGWITQLSALEDSALTPIIDDLDSLLTALDERNTDAATVAMMSLSEETASLAEALDNDMLRQLSELLANARQEASEQETNEQEMIDEAQSVGEGSVDVAQEEASEGERASDGEQSITKQTLEGTIAVLEAGATTIPIVVVRAIVNGWIEQLSAREDPALTPTIEGLTHLVDAFNEGDPEAATAAVLRLSETTADLADDTDDDTNIDLLRQLAEILAEIAGE